MDNSSTVYVGDCRGPVTKHEFEATIDQLEKYIRNLQDAQHTMEEEVKRLKIKVYGKN